MRITLDDGGLFAFAGLWERWTEPESGLSLQSCTIITTAPNALMETIHNRMPVIIPPDSYATWLDYKTTDTAKVVPLIVSYPAEKMRAYPVSRMVNSPAIDSPDLIASIL